MLNPDLIERIRAIFLQAEPHVTIETAAHLLGMSRREIASAIDRGTIETVSTCSGPAVDVHELAEQALHRWPVATIEDALGEEAALVMPSGVRTRRFTVRLPRYLVATAERLAEENGESADAFLTRELHHFAQANEERLSASIAGFADAVNWPFSAAAEQES